MIMDIDYDALEHTLSALKDRLLRYRVEEGHWVGQLSSSALSTATASFALSLVDREKYQTLIRKGLDWLCENQNPDGGWGDTVRSLSNISTTMLCWSALTTVDRSQRYEKCIAKAESWLCGFAGSVEPAVLAGAIDRKYGEDRSFSAPILTMCALAGRLGNSDRAWELVKPLPFELSVCPARLFKWLRLQVVSYALPALIAIGQAHYYHRKPKCPVKRMLRHISRGKTLNVLKRLQPANGGFLEATPLTAFVVMSLAGSGQSDNDVVSKGVRFLVESAREDGSWPIDTNLALWVTTLTTNALAVGDDFESLLQLKDRRNIRNLLISSQYDHTHPYTQAAPGGWGWTNLPGSVPDADDTAGALIALKNLGFEDEQVVNAATAGITWLLDLQNRDGGIPTFCRGWAALPFDRSAPDLTAHALGAAGLWLDKLPPSLKRRATKAARKQLSYLQCAQRDDGSWIPLWFGNELAPDKENPVYGTARVLSGLCRMPQDFGSLCLPMQSRAVQWLVSAQNADGGWGGDKSVKSSVEETALALEALADVLLKSHTMPQTCVSMHVSDEILRSAVSQATAYLIAMLFAEDSAPASPIGLYFAKLWYYEELYPYIFSVSALNKLKNLRRIQ